MYLLLLSLVSFCAFAQHSEQPAQESSTDLRNNFIMFSIQEMESDRTYTLLRTPGLDYFLQLKVKGEDSVRKVDSRSAQKLDRDFAARFLKCEYELPKFDGECKSQIKMTMKGEVQDVCQKEDQKSQELKPLIEDLHKRF